MDLTYIYLQKHVFRHSMLSVVVYCKDILSYSWAVWVERYTFFTFCLIQVAESETNFVPQVMASSSKQQSGVHSLTWQTCSTTGVMVLKCTWTTTRLTSLTGTFLRANHSVELPLRIIQAFLSFYTKI